MHNDLFLFVLVHNIYVRIRSSHFGITAVIVPIEFIISHHTFRKLPCYTKVAVSRLLFGASSSHKVVFQFFKLLDNLRKVLHTGISDGIPCLLVFLDLTLVLKPREVTNPFPDVYNFPFDSEDAVFILFRLSNFDDMYKVTYLSLPLIYLCFITLR